MPILAGATSVKVGSIAANRVMAGGHQAWPVDPGEAPADAGTVSGLVGRWRADSIGQGNGTAVASWAALVGGAALTQATSGSRPTYFTTGAANGQPCVRFDGTGDHLVGTITAVPQPLTIVVVHDKVDVSGYETLLFGGVEMQFIDDRVNFWGGSANVETAFGAGHATTQPAVETAILNSTVVTAYVAGQQVMTGFAGSSGLTSSIRVGGHGSVTRPYAGDVYEILVYNRALDATDRDTVHAYVNYRYGISVTSSGGGGSTGGGGGGGSSPSGQAMPTSAPTGWTRIFSEDFNTDQALGTWPGVYGTNWYGYDADDWGIPEGEGTDTSGAGRYDRQRVVSASGGVMSYYVHTADGMPRVAAEGPKIAGAENSRLYGRYTVRWRADSLPGYKNAWLLWPSSNDWQEGEIDYPEGDLDSGSMIEAFNHQIGNPSVNAANFTAGVSMVSGWHTSTIEWTAGQIKFILDGVTLGTTTASVPNTPFRWVLQTETNLAGITPSASVAGKVEVDWVTIDAPTS